MASSWGDSWSDHWGNTWGPITVDPNAMVGTADFGFLTAGKLEENNESVGNGSYKYRRIKRGNRKQTDAERIRQIINDRIDNSREISISIAKKQAKLLDGSYGGDSKIKSKSVLRDAEIKQLIHKKINDEKLLLQNQQAIALILIMAGVN